MRSVRFRLLVWNISILAIALFSFQFLAHFAIRTILLAEMDKRANSMTERVIHFFTEAPLDRRPQPPMNFRRTRMEIRRPEMIRTFDLQGKALPHPGPPSTKTVTFWDRTAFIQASRGRTVHSFVHDPDENGALMRILSQPLWRNGARIGVIQVAVPYEEMQALLDNLMRIFFILIPCALVLAGMGGVFLTDRALRPVRHIVQTAEQLNPEDLSQRLPVTGFDEFAHLAATMNSMLSRIEKTVAALKQALQRERRFTSDASHELRTPLTIIRANSSLALEDDNLSKGSRTSLQAIDQAAIMMQRLVEDLLLLARSDSDQLQPRCADIEVHDLFADAMQHIHPGNGYPAIHLAIADDAETIWGDALQLQRVMANLLDNALRHTPAEGSVTLSASRENGQVILRVTDTGTGIAPEDLAHLGERFYRIDASRTRQHGGTGLGLAICKGIIEAHHGELRIDSTSGEGTTVQVILPQHPA